jgi:hypothetical protein
VRRPNKRRGNKRKTNAREAAKQRRLAVFAGPAPRSSSPIVHHGFGFKNCFYDSNTLFCVVLLSSVFVPLLPSVLVDRYRLLRQEVDRLYQSNRSKRDRRDRRDRIRAEQVNLSTFG